MSAMKTLIILSQMLLLLVIAWFTRPAQEDFNRYLSHHSSAATRATSNAQADATTNTKDCQFRDRWLWVEVTKDQKVVYVGALAHWFDCSMVERNDMSHGVALAGE